MITRALFFVLAFLLLLLLLFRPILDRLFGKVLSWGVCDIGRSFDLWPLAFGL